jgi:hypothetical protein
VPDDLTIRGVAYYEGLRRAREARPMTDMRRKLTDAIEAAEAADRRRRRARLVGTLVEGAVCALIGFAAGLAIAEAWLR